MKHGVLILVFAVIVYTCGAQDKNIQKAIENGTFNEMVEPTKPEATEFYEPIPPTVNPTGQNGVPTDAIVLFDGSNLDEWIRVKDAGKATWVLNKADKSMTVNKGEENMDATIQTKQVFGSVQLHLEWKSPEKIEDEGQHRGNSGVFLQGRYEVQVLDNNDNDTYVNGQVGSIYKQSIPLAKASVPTGKWNTYDIIYHAPKFNEVDEKTKSATITVLHNGILIQDHYVIKGTTPYIGWPKNEAHGKGPIMLQDHGSPVSYRNIWVRALD